MAINLASIIITSAVGVMIFLSVTLNSLVLYVFFKRYKKLEFVHVVLMSIAFSDILMSTFGFVPEIISTIANSLQEDGFICISSGFLIYGLAVSIIAHISCFNLIRTIAIIYPIHYRWMFKNIPLRYAILFICHVYGLGWAAFPLMGWSTYKLDLDGRRCTVDWKLTHPTSMSYIICVLIFCFFIPGTIIIFSIIWGKIGLQKNRKSAARRTSNLHTSLKRKDSKKLLEDNLLRLFIIMAVMFFIAWTPYTITGILAACHKTPYESFVTISAVFAKLSSISNPIINCFINKHFRKKLFRTPCIRRIMKNLFCFNYYIDSLSKDSDDGQSSKQTSELLRLSRDPSSTKTRASIITNDDSDTKNKLLYSKEDEANNLSTIV